MLLCTACGTARPIESELTRTELPTEAVALAGATHGDPAKPVPAKAPPTRAAQAPLAEQNILALSGGGADGAFGAGVLVGWTESGKRPKFDIVTGVSTGSFMAALAFLGPQYDGVMTRLYTRQSNDTIFIDRGAAGLASDSLYDNTPLAKLIEKTVTKSFVAEVAAQHAAGRRLYIATTNLDAGELVVWDMGQIAAGDRADPVLMFQKILRASAAVPGFFPPVYIKPVKGKELRQAHVDGGVKAPILIRNFMFETPAKTRRLYAIVNGNLSRLNASAVQAKLTDIGKKSISELLRSLTETSVYQGYVAARQSATDFNLIAIPDEFGATSNALDFDPKKMKALYETGRELGRGQNKWLKEPPRLEQFERVPGPPAQSQIAKAPALVAAPVVAAATDVQRILTAGRVDP